jgi:hypothetical protein
MPSIIGLDGDPLAPPEILERLHRVDPALGMKFIQEIGWAVTYRWPLDDPRRARVQLGELGPGAEYDIFAFLPEDCSPDEAFGYIERKFVRNSGRAEIASLLDRLDNYNDKQEENALQSTTDLAEELIETNAHTLFEGKHIPKSTKVGRHKSKKDEKQFQEFLRDS